MTGMHSPASPQSQGAQPLPTHEQQPHLIPSSSHIFRNRRAQLDITNCGQQGSYLPIASGAHPSDISTMTWTSHSSVSNVGGMGSEWGRAALTHVEVMVRKRSCPAVSQICSFTFSPLISTVRILKSTPIVVM